MASSGRSAPSKRVIAPAITQVSGQDSSSRYPCAETTALDPARALAGDLLPVEWSSERKLDAFAICLQRRGDATCVSAVRAIRCRTNSSVSGSGSGSPARIVIYGDRRREELGLPAALAPVSSSSPNDPRSCSVARSGARRASRVRCPVTGGYTTCTGPVVASLTSSGPARARGDPGGRSGTTPSKRPMRRRRSRRR